VDIKTVEIDSEVTPFGRLTLHRYLAETGEVGYEIRLDDNFLMASHGSHSERAMARLAHNRLTNPSTDLRVLIGGLGAGHTLRAALDLVGVERVEVAEIGAKVVEWNRHYFGEVNGHAVDDPRVTIHVADVLDVIRGASGKFDLVLLDVDNGPDWLATPSNARLYDIAGLTDCARCLRPGGVLALWTPQRIAAVETGLRAVFNDVGYEDTIRIARAADEPPSMIYLAVNRPQKR